MRSLNPEVPLGERSSRTGLEVAFEPKRRRFVGKLDRHNDVPRSMANGVAAGTIVVPVEAFVHIARDTDVVASGIAFAAQNVDEPLPDAEHGRAEWQVSRQQETR